MTEFKRFLELYNENDYICISQIEEKPIQRMIKVKEAMNEDHTGKSNMFFSPNTFGFRMVDGKPTINRDKQHVEKLSCLYVDLDYYKINCIDEESALKWCNDHVIGYELPIPTMINCSGSGIHMYWKISPITYKHNIDKWLAMQKYIMKCFDMLESDSVVSCGHERIMRIPGTINHKGEKYTKCYNMELNEDAVYDLDELIDEYEVEVVSMKLSSEVMHFKKKEDKYTEKSSNRENKSVDQDKKGTTGSNIIPFAATLYRNRMKDLENLLLNHRDIESNRRRKEKATVTGYRENILYLYRFNSLMLHGDEKKALEDTLELNSRLNNPLDEKEILLQTKSAQKGYEHCWKWSNRKLIQFLNITEEEMKDMISIMDDKEKRRRKAERDRAAYLSFLRKQGKDTKQEQIIARRVDVYTLLKRGYNAKEIIDMLQCSKSTIYSDIQEVQKEEFIEVYNEYMDIEEKSKENTGTDGAVLSFPKNFTPVLCLFSFTCVNSSMSALDSGYMIAGRASPGQ